MPRIIFVLILYTASAPVLAQIVSIKKFYHNGKEMVSHGFPYFSFHELDTTLTDATREYLDVFGKYYRDSLLSTDQYFIDLTPGMSVAEREVDIDLGVKRARVVINYLKNTHGMGEENFRVRLKETSTTTCVGFLLVEKDSKRNARRERRRLRKEHFDEDAYFKD